MGAQAEGGDRRVRRVVSDTGPLLHLHEAKALDLMSLTGDVHIPIAVDAEMSQHEATWPIHRPTWVIIDTVLPPYTAEAEAWQQAGLLDVGEAQAIALTRQLSADWLLTDDAAARLLGQSLGLEVHGSLGIVLWSAATGHLTHAEAESILNRLANSSLWISARVLAEAKEALKKLLS